MRLQERTSWPALPPVKGPPGYRFEQLRRAYVGRLIAALRNWYSDITVGSESCHLEEAFYEQEVALVETAQDRPIYACVVVKDEALVGMYTFEYQPLPRLVVARLGVADPDHRGVNLSSSLFAIEETMAIAVGAELIVHHATLTTPQSQRVQERNGFALVGIIPGHDRDRVRPETIKRVHEALYVKSLVPGTQLEAPRKDLMTPTVRRLYEFLFERVD